MLLTLGRGLSPRQNSGTIFQPVITTLSDFPFVFAAFTPENANNSSITVNQDFTASNIEITTNEIDLGLDLQFKAFTTATSCSGNAIYFTTTGTLPAGLDENTPYYLSPTTGTKYKIYPEPVDHIGLDHALPSENIFPVQNFAQRQNEINLTSQGTGTHTIYSDELIEYLYNETDNEYRVEPLDSNNRHTFHQIKVDSQGRKYTYNRLQVRDPEGTGRYDAHSKNYKLDVFGNTPRLQFKQESGEKRIIMQTHVCRLEQFLETGNKKAFCNTSDINITSNQIRSNGHLLNDGDRVRVMNHANSTLPTGLNENTDYIVEDISGNFFKFFPTETDRISGTNEINISNVGSGTFTVYASNTIDDFNRWAFFVELIEPGTNNANTCAPRIDNNAGGATVFDERAFRTDGLLGRNGVKVTDWIGEFPNSFANGVATMWLSFPPESLLPLRADTNTRMVSGTYYMTQEPGSSVYGRLHSTEQDALDCVGLSYNHPDAIGKYIKYTDIGDVYEVHAYYIAQAAYVQNADGDIVETGRKLIPYDNEVHAYTFLLDYNDPNANSVLAKLYIDGILFESIETGHTKGLTNVAFDTNVGTLYNSAASHVPFVGDGYGHYFGSNVNGITESELNEWHDFIKSKHGLS